MPSDPNETKETKEVTHSQILGAASDIGSCLMTLGSMDYAFTHTDYSCGLEALEEMLRLLQSAQAVLEQLHKEASERYQRHMEDVAAQLTAVVASRFPTHD